jgi:hypothetical protein
MARKTKTDPPRIGRKDLQDPDRDTQSRKDEELERDSNRSDREAGAGRPVQLDEEGRSRPPESDSRRPSDDAVVPK